MVVPGRSAPAQGLPRWRGRESEKGRPPVKRTARRSALLGFHLAKFGVAEVKLCLTFAIRELCYLANRITTLVGAASVLRC